MKEGADSYGQVAETAGTSGSPDNVGAQHVEAEEADYGRDGANNDDHKYQRHPISQRKEETTTQMPMQVKTSPAVVDVAVTRHRLRLRA